jgi:hypothetical protein
MFVTFLVWLLLAAPSLKRAAEASPFGARRTAAIVVLAPFDAMSHLLQLSRVDAAAQSALGRDASTGGGGDSGNPVGAPPSGVDASPPTQHTPEPGRPHSPSPQPTLRRPTKAHPLTVLSVGDSIGIDLGFGVQRVMGNTGYYKVIVDGKISTGLARPDYFNWSARLEMDIKRYHPDIVVMLVGLNDPQAMRTANGRYLPTFSRAWFEEYARRVDRILELGTADGRRIVWAGAPIVAPPQLRHDVRWLNGAYRKQVRLYPGAIYFDTWRYTAPHGTYSAFLNGANGNHFEARTGDGIHLTNAGQDYLGRILFQQVRTDLLGRAPRTQP